MDKREQENLLVELGYSNWWWNVMQNPCKRRYNWLQHREYKYNNLTEARRTKKENTIWPSQWHINNQNRRSISQSIRTTPVIVEHTKWELGRVRDWRERGSVYLDLAVAGKTTIEEKDLPDLRAFIAQAVDYGCSLVCEPSHCYMVNDILLRIFLFVCFPCISILCDGWNTRPIYREMLV